MEKKIAKWLRRLKKASKKRGKVKIEPDNRYSGGGHPPGPYRGRKKKANSNAFLTREKDWGELNRTEKTSLGKKGEKRLAAQLDGCRYGGN